MNAEPQTEIDAELPAAFKKVVKKATEAGEYTITVSFCLAEDIIWAKAGQEVPFGQYTYNVRTETIGVDLLTEAVEVTPYLLPRKWKVSCIILNCGKQLYSGAYYDAADRYCW